MNFTQVAMHLSVNVLNTIQCKHKFSCEILNVLFLGEKKMFLIFETITIVQAMKRNAKQFIVSCIDVNSVEKKKNKNLTTITNVHIEIIQNVLRKRFQLTRRLKILLIK